MGIPRNSARLGNSQFFRSSSKSSVMLSVNKTLTKASSTAPVTADVLGCGFNQPKRPTINPTIKNKSEFESTVRRYNPDCNTANTRVAVNTRVAREDCIV